MSQPHPVTDAAREHARRAPPVPPTWPAGRAGRHLRAPGRSTLLSARGATSVRLAAVAVAHEVARLPGVDGRRVEALEHQSSIRAAESSIRSTRAMSSRIASWIDIPIVQLATEAYGLPGRHPLRRAAARPGSSHRRRRRHGAGRPRRARRARGPRRRRVRRRRGRARARRGLRRRGRADLSSPGAQRHLELSFTFVATRTALGVSQRLTLCQQSRCEREADEEAATCGSGSSSSESRFQLDTPSPRLHFATAR